MKKVVALGLALTLSLGLVGCGAKDNKKEDSSSQNVSEENMLKIKNNLGDNALEFEDITSIDDKKGFETLNTNSDGYMWIWKGLIDDYKTGRDSFGCTAVMKEIDGQMLMSRNMDYIVNNKTECVFKVDAPDRYKSYNVTNYSPKNSGDYADIVKNGGISKDKVESLSYFATDGINEKGLVIEFNMRPTEFESDGVTPILISDGTNPGKTRVPIPALVRLGLDRCDSVEDLLKMIGAVNGTTGEKYGDGEYDFYTNLSEDLNWILTFSIMDSTGKHGVLEPIDNKLVWTENAKGQANFFVDKETESKELYGSGYGRWNYIMSKYDDVKTPDELFALTKEISYKQAEMNTAPWDIATENTHTDVFGVVEKLSDFAKKNGVEIPDTKDLKQTITTADGKQVVLTMDNYKDYDPAVRAAMWTKDFVEKDETGEVAAKIAWTAAFYKSLTDQQAKDLNFFWNTGHHELYNANEKTLKVEFWENGKTFDFSL